MEKQAAETRRTGIFGVLDRNVDIGQQVADTHSTCCFCLVCERDGYERKGRQGIEKKKACIHNPSLSRSFLSSCISNIHREEIAWTRMGRERMRCK